MRSSWGGRTLDSLLAVSVPWETTLTSSDISKRYSLSAVGGVARKLRIPCEARKVTRLGVGPVFDCFGATAEARRSQPSPRTNVARVKNAFCRTGDSAGPTAKTCPPRTRTTCPRRTRTNTDGRRAWPYGPGGRRSRATTTRRRPIRTDCRPWPGVRPRRSDGNPIANGSCTWPSTTWRTKKHPEPAINEKPLIVQIASKNQLQHYRKRNTNMTFGWYRCFVVSCIKKTIP